MNICASSSHTPRCMHSIKCLSLCFVRYILLEAIPCSCRGHTELPSSFFSTEEEEFSSKASWPGPIGHVQEVAFFYRSPLTLSFMVFSSDHKIFQCHVQLYFSWDTIVLELFKKKYFCSHF